MKILILAPNLKRGGAERVLSELSLEWSKNDNITFSLFDKKDIAYSYGGKIINIGYPSNTLFFFKIYNFIMRLKSFYKISITLKPDLIISFTESANFIAIFSSLFSGTLNKTIISVRVAPERFKLITKLLVFLFYRLPFKIVAPSEGIQRALQKYGLPKKKIEFIPNPISIISNINKKSPLNENLIEKEFILAAGRLEYQKGFDILIKSFSKINDKKIKLVILGDGSLKYRLIELAKKEKIESDRIMLPGAVEDISIWFKKAKFFILSSRYEGWPNVLMESLANGCPAIAFDCKHGPREIIKNFENGILVQPEDKKKLTQAIDTLNSSNTIRNTFKKNGYKTAKKYESTIIANKWFQIL